MEGLKRIRLLLDSLSYHLDVNVYFSLSKANMKGISYWPLYTSGFFLMISWTIID
ncbi:hypothetical protein H8356DRAFT_1337001 [Neocallimastix lanati (nom. inval.)]|nr:hypothetical protein H8356DRAFT_1337001 [Neocallimastix sp. JGI-2020a]